MALFNTISKDRCFNVEQIRAISIQFPFGDEKLIVFKSSHDKCIDKLNYYKLTDELTFSSHKDDLRSYIKNH